jgi:hypothetical protein
VQAIDLISAARFGQPSETVKLDVFVVSRARPPTPFCKTATPSSSAPRVDSRDLRERMANGMIWVNGKRSQKTKMLELGSARGFSRPPRKDGQRHDPGKREAKPKTKMLERQVLGTRAVQWVSLVEARLTLTAARYRP